MLGTTMLIAQAKRATGLCARHLGIDGREIIKPLIIGPTGSNWTPSPLRSTSAASVTMFAYHFKPSNEKPVAIPAA